MFGGLITFLYNTFFDIRDYYENKENADLDLNANIIEIPLIVSDDINIKTYRNMEQAFQVLYSILIENMILMSSRSRFDSSRKDILSSIPILNNADTVVMKKDSLKMAGLVDKIFSTPVNNSEIKNVFSESINRSNLKSKYVKVTLESNIDPLYKDSKGATIIKIDLNMSPTGGKISKSITLGVNVIPTVYTKTEIMQLFKKQSLDAVVKLDDVSKKNDKKIEKIKDRSREFSSVIDASQKKTLNDKVNMVKGIKKPFFGIMISENVYNDCKNTLNVDMTDNKTLNDFYNKVPILNFSIYDSAKDSIRIKMSHNTPWSSYSIADLMTNVSTYEKELSHIIRANTKLI